MLIKTMKPDFSFDNECGSLVQLVHDGWKQINIIHSVAGCERGGHYHKYNTEAFYVIQGSFTLKVYKGDETEEYEFSAGDMFQIMPYVSHTFMYHTDTYLIGMYDHGVEISETKKDIWQGQI